MKKYYGDDLKALEQSHMLVDAHESNNNNSKS